jgi:hypothetical protein
MMLKEEIELPEQKPVPVLRCPQQVPHELAYDQIRACMVKGRRRSLEFCGSEVI